MTPAQRRRKARQRQAVDLRAKGWSLRAIAAHLGVTHSTVLLDLQAVDSAGQNQPPSGRNRPAESTDTTGVDWDAEMIQLSKEAP